MCKMLNKWGMFIMMFPLPKLLHTYTICTICCKSHKMIKIRKGDGINKDVLNANIFYMYHENHVKHLNNITNTNTNILIMAILIIIILALRGTALHRCTSLAFDCGDSECILHEIG